ncbi:amidase signature domain-containing protein [Chaetomidium leptoderma]|uniref:Amidase signature domain-containing protein n=1 Tax=Chaetomidium leptoderma TaxID=669021 RepID=A0AAN6VHY9_9PEZI|nr:amidase signature domain-containing protein [Chaetomidium leptoderma]
MATTPRDLPAPELQRLSTQQILSLSARDVRQLFDNGTLTIPGLLSRVLLQINNENEHGLQLRAILSLAPEPQLHARAQELDQELQSGRSRDCIATAPDFGMPTTAGSFALLNATKATKNAPVVERLLSAGVIIVGKSNLSELCAFKGDGLIDGFSPVGGQTKSPYVYGDIVLDEGDLSPTSPGGSSTGSAVSVSAGFALLGVGTENDGSIVQPASRQALYALKPTLGFVSAEGSWSISKSLDTPGAMARSVHDLAAATEALLNPAARAKLPTNGYQSFMSTSFKDMKLGVVNPAVWRFPPDLWVPSEEAKQQHDTAYSETWGKMRSLGAEVAYNISLPLAKELTAGEDYTPSIVNSYELEETANEFLRGYTETGSEVHDLAKAPDQSYLIKAVENRPSEDQYRNAFEHMRKIGRDEGLDKAFDEHNLDIVIAPMDSPICSLSMASGYPIANVPLGRYRLKGQLSRPFGLAALARQGAETTLFRFMSAYEANFPARVIPEQLLGASKN